MLVKCPNVGKEEMLVSSGSWVLVVTVEVTDDEAADEEATSTLEVLLATETVEDPFEAAREEVVEMVDEVEAKDEVELAALEVDEEAVSSSSVRSKNLMSFTLK